MKQLSREELKNVQLDLLKVVDKFCRDNNIKYFLAYGTLIGAIRHKGFIPWDDDIDLMMKREDYDKFISLFPHKGTDKNPYYVGAIEIDDNYPYPFAKIQNCKTAIDEELDYNYDMGCNIDLFPIDNMPDDQNKGKRVMKKTLILEKILWVKALRIIKRRGILKNAFLAISHLVLSVIPMKSLLKAINKNARQYSRINSNTVGLVTSYMPSMSYHIDKSLFDDAIDVDFEGYQFMAPKEYDKLLRILYGDYMQLPPEEQRIPKHRLTGYFVE